MVRCLACLFILAIYFCFQSCASVAAVNQGITGIHSNKWYADTANNNVSGQPVLIVSPDGQGLELVFPTDEDLLVKFDLFDADGQILYSGDVRTGFKSKILLPLDARQLDRGNYLLRTVSLATTLFHPLTVEQ